MSVEDDRIYAQLALLRNIHLSTMSPEEYIQWQNKIDDIEDEYKAAKANADRSQYAKDVCDSIAKGLPTITKGVLSAVTAFEKGDAITGTAAVMDICSGAAPIISAILGAAGPEGMLVGALFSMVGQILAFFGPKQPSLQEQIKEMLQTLNAETQLQDMEAVRLSIEEFDKRLTAAYHELTRRPAPDRGVPPGILSLPLLTENDANAFIVRMKALNLGIVRSEQKLDMPKFKTWQVAAWLKMPEKQGYAKWPEVLGVWCRAYTDLITANMKFNCLIDPKLVQEKVEFTNESNSACPLPPLKKAEVNGILTDLQALALELRQESATCNAIALEILQAVTPTAQTWGLFACIATNYGLYFASGLQNIKNPNWTNRSDSNYYHRIALLTAADGGTGRYDLKPQYHCLLLKSTGTLYPGSHHWADHLWVRSDTFDVSYDRLIRDYPNFSDICAAQIDDGRLDCWSGSADSVQRWSLDGANNYNTGALADTNSKFATRSAVEHVRALYLGSDSMLQDDPDGDVIAAGASWSRQGIVYAALRSAPEICVIGLDTAHYVQSPWPAYSGIEVDRHFLWVFHPFGFACATHASIISCILNKRATPAWMQYELPVKMLGRYTTNVRGDGLSPDDRAAAFVSPWHPENLWTLDGGTPQKPMPPLQALISMSPCSDGTIYASVVYREAYSDGAPPVTWRARDTAYKGYTTPYVSDIKNHTIAVSEPWTEIGAEARQVLKMPIPCWPMIVSLKEKLPLQ